MRLPVLSAKQRRAVVDAYLGGASIRELAARYGCSTAPIVNALDLYCVERRPSNNPAGRPARRDAEMRGET
jgi:transposase